MLTLPAMSCNETIAKNIIAAYDITRGIVNHRALSPPPHYVYNMMLRQMNDKKAMKQIPEVVNIIMM